MNGAPKTRGKTATTTTNPAHKHCTLVDKLLPGGYSGPQYWYCCTVGQALDILKLHFSPAYGREVTTSTGSMSSSWAHRKTCSRLTPWDTFRAIYCRLKTYTAYPVLAPKIFSKILPLFFPRGHIFKIETLQKERVLDFQVFLKKSHQEEPSNPYWIRVWEKRNYILWHQDFETLSIRTSFLNGSSSRHYSINIKISELSSSIVA